MPSAIATKLNTTFWWNGHGSPPTDLSKWEDMIRATMEHWQERYGTEKLEQWYFEVWNEVRTFFQLSLKSANASDFTSSRILTDSGLVPAPSTTSSTRLQ
jgi:beta-xylosidase